MAWEDLRLENLRIIARQYNSDVKMVAISKMKKAELIEELKKHLVLNAEGNGVTHKGGKEGFEWELEEKPKKEKKEKSAKKGEPKITKVYEAAGEGSSTYKMKEKEVAKKADVPAPPPPKKAEDKSYKKKVVAKKVVQARGAAADAMAIRPPAPLPEYASETSMMAPKGYKEKKAIERKAIPQAREAAADAMAMGYQKRTLFDWLDDERKEKMGEKYVPRQRFTFGLKKK